MRWITDFAVASGEYGISVIVLFVLGIFSFILVRRRKDPLRTPFLYLKLAIPFYFVSSLALAVYYIICTISFDSNDSLFNISGCVESVGYFLELVGDVQILLCIVELSLSFSRAMGRLSGAQTRIRMAAIAAAVLLLVLAIAYVGVDQAYINSTEYTGISVSTIIGLNAAWSVIYFLIALALEALSLMVFWSSHKARQYTKLTRRLLAVTTLNNLRTSYNLYLIICYLRDPFYLPDNTFILTPILYMWTTIVILSLLTDIGSRKHDGLWSDPNSASGNHLNNGFHPGPWNSGNAGPNTQSWGGYQQQQPPAYGQSQQPGSYNPDQQPKQAEVPGSNVPVRGELAVTPSQRYQEMYMQRQPPYADIQQSAPVEVHGQPISPSGPVPGVLTAQQQQYPPGQLGVQQVFEVAGIAEQKG